MCHIFPLFRDDVLVNDEGRGHQKEYDYHFILDISRKLLILGLIYVAWLYQQNLALGRKPNFPEKLPHV